MARFYNSLNIDIDALKCFNSYLEDNSFMQRLLSFYLRRNIDITEIE